MVPWILLALPISVLAATEHTHGVPPHLLPKYVPLTAGSKSTWKCLDGSKEIPWSAVNDDYCDCRDGSDEPGTGACLNTRFYCKNEGHIGAYVPSTRVNDGLCEPDCCDGSDERPGVCKDTCKEIGDAYRAKQDAERKLRKTGAKIRSSYINFAQKEKLRLEAELAASEQEIASRQKEVDRLQDLVDRTESLSAAALEHKKLSPLYHSLMKHHHALRSLRLEHQKHLEREEALGQILNTLRANYNPNYQDMAVLDAVRGWEYHAGLPHINDVGKEQVAEGSDEVDNTAEEGSDEVDEDDEVDPYAWTPQQLEQDLPRLLDTNYESLLLEHEQHIGATTTTESVLFDLSAYIPDALAPQYEQIREGVVTWLRTFGVIKDGATSADAADTSRAKQALSDAQQALSTATDQKSNAEEGLSRLYDPAWFGREGEWKKLDGTCLEKDTGDYTYEVCLFGEAKQKPNNGGSSFSLGHFVRWNEGDKIAVASPEYYSKQFYKQGAKCWNGPQRSVVLVWTCGTENAILSVQELEKCEYQFTGTSPALCLPLDATEHQRNEL